MLEVMSLRLNAGSQPRPPLFHSYMYVNDTLLQLCPNNDEALLQLVDVPYRCLVYAFLYYTPNSVVNWIEVWGVCWPEFWSNEAWCFTSQQRNGVLCSMCWGAVLLEDEEVARPPPDRWQQLLHQQDIPVIFAVDLHPRFHEEQFRGLRVQHICYPTRTRSTGPLPVPVPDPYSKLLPDPYPRVYPYPSLSSLHMHSIRSYQANTLCMLSTWHVVIVY